MGLALFHYLTFLSNSRGEQSTLDTIVFPVINELLLKRSFVDRDDEKVAKEWPI